MRADLILVGHTHHPEERRLAGAQVVNPGSVSLPRTSDAVTRYAILTSHDGAWTVEHRAVPYDRDTVLTDLHDRGPSRRRLADREADDALGLRPLR